MSTDAASTPNPQPSNWFSRTIAGVEGFFTRATTPTTDAIPPGPIQTVVDGLIDAEIALALNAMPGVLALCPQLPVICDTVANNVVAKLFDRWSLGTTIKPHVGPVVLPPAPTPPLPGAIP